jgi:predicted neutral ceramidase superfamily lipid hydrolase
VERQDTEDLINRLYQKLFYLPRTTLLSSAYIVEGLIASWLNIGSLKGSPLVILPTFIGFALYLTLIYVAFVAGAAVDSMKKALGIAVFSIAPYIIVDLVASHRERYFLSFASSSGMIFLTHYIFKGRMIRSLLIAMICSMIPTFSSILGYRSLSISHNSLVNSEDIIIVASASTASIGSFALFIAILELSGRASGMKTFEVARGFLRAWLFGETEILEGVFLRNSVKNSLKIRVISIYRDKGKPLHIIYPNIHFGPFRRVGSSDAVHIFDRYIESLGHRSLVLHTIGSHERNIVKRSYVEQVANELSKKLVTMDTNIGSLRGPIRIGSGSWRGMAFGGDGCIALHISNINGSDDLPESIEKIFYGIEKASGVMIAAADSHNNYGKEEVDEEAMAEIAVNSIKSIVRKPGWDNTMVGYGEAYMEKPCKGMCIGRVKAIVFRNSNGDVAMIYLYGNNVHRTARKIIMETATKMGFKDVEVITPDDHSCAAESLGTAYTAIHPCQGLINAIASALRMALEDLKPARIACREYVWNDAPFMGRVVWNYLKALEVLGPLTSKLWVITLVASIAVTSAISGLFLL